MKVPQIVVDPDFSGPSILDFKDALESSTSGEMLKIRWSNSQKELTMLKSYPMVAFQLVVKDLLSMERTATSVGSSLTYSDQMVNNAKVSLLSTKKQNWRPFINSIGASASKSLLVKIVANSLRSGNNPRQTCLAVHECLFNGMNPLDVDVLLRLKTLL